MSEDFRCDYCLNVTEYDELEYGWCPECTDEVTHDIDLMLEYVNTWHYGKPYPSLEHEFYVNWCYCADDKEQSNRLMLLCKHKVLEDIKLDSNNRRQALTDFCREDLSTYLDWVSEKKRSVD